jgi:dTDP-4-amino-4,6-dideoxygalactose transaminase
LKGSSDVVTPVISANSTHVFHQYTLQLAEGLDREKIRTIMAENGVPAMIYYPVPLHFQKAYKSDRYKAGDFEITERLCKTVISLPMHSELDSSTQDYIIENLLNAINYSK